MKLTSLKHFALITSDYSNNATATLTGSQCYTGLMVQLLNPQLSGGNGMGLSKAGATEALDPTEFLSTLLSTSYKVCFLLIYASVI
ncbi:MAG: hypothetical protein JWO13_2608 [Acidobacteriales bacterium]|nr:hypothetical protein [Terriglobales bacterium]